MITLKKVYIHINSACTYCVKQMNVSFIANCTGAWFLCCHVPCTDVEIIIKTFWFKEQVPLDSRTPTIKAPGLLFSFFDNQLHLLLACMDNRNTNPPKHAFNPQRVHDMLKLIFLKRNLTRFHAGVLLTTTVNLVHHNL